MSKQNRCMEIPFLMHEISSLAEPTKFVPLSDQMTEGVPRRAMKRFIPITQELASIDGTTSRLTARVVMHVNKKPQRFSELSRIVTWNGPK